MKNKILKQTFLLGLFILLANCASVPIMPENLDQQGKTFRAPSNKANLYVTRRKSIWGSGVILQIIVDGKIRGAVASGTYLLLELEPGEHNVSVILEESSNFVNINAIEGNNYFIEIKPKWGWFSGGISLKKLKEREGQKLVQKAKRAQHIAMAK